MEPSGIFAFGANFPARLAAAAAPRTIPKFITDVTSASTLALSAACGPGQFQTSHVATGTPTACAALAPHRPKPNVTDQGWPARSSVATLSRAMSSPAPTRGHGP